VVGLFVVSVVLVLRVRVQMSRELRRIVVEDSVPVG
jgi:hypothetical protein